jgi:asparagine synthase (glutamine-hydrolysing)
MGVYKIYRADAWSVVSSSFLLALTAIDRPLLDHQGVYEYVFEGATFGGRTIVKGLQLLDRRQVGALGQRARLQAIPDSRPENLARGAFARGAFARHVERTVGELSDWFGEFAAAFGGNVDTALSGGYDSRLILALARAGGRRPRVHVYGGPNDPDVAIAKAIAAGEGFPLEHIDKSARQPPSPGEFGAVVERNMLAFDGNPPDGIFDGGADLASRLDRCRGGALALNGGGGEIFRNFFYLRDGRFGIRDVLAAFHSQFDPASATELFAEGAYIAHMAHAMEQTLGRGGERLSRVEVEYLYPYFRCAFWMGRNNSINSRLGHALTPFIDPAIVAGALGVPLAFKNHGRFEAALIAAIDPVLARYPSAYGHDFVTPPPWQRRLKSTLDMWRPVMLRRYSFRLKARLKPAQRPRLLQADYLGQVVDPAMPAMARFFRLANLRAADQFARAATLEYLCQRYRLSPD